jgi:hypothetical protein
MKFHHIKMVVVCFVVAGVMSCGGGSGGGGGGGDGSESRSVAAISLDEGRFGALMASGEELLLPLVERDLSGAPTKLTGVLWLDRESGATVLVYFGDGGRPEKAVISNFILLFTNWSEDGGSADIALIYTPTGYIEIFKRADAAQLITASVVERGTCFPACGTEIKNLAELLKIAGLGISLGSCGIATTISFGAAAIPCTGVIITTASLITDPPSWLEDLPGVADVIGCGTGEPWDCVSVMLDMGGRTMNLLDQDIAHYSDLVTTAGVFLSNPDQQSGVVQEGGGLPALPETYQCTPGGSMSYLPCYPEGVRECQNNYTWGPCSGEVCGDDICSAGEDASNCPADCSMSPPPCVYTYTEWSECQPDDTKRRYVISSSPPGCEGSPITEQGCVYADATCCKCYFDVYCTVYGPGGCWYCSNSTYVGDVCQAPYGYLTSPGSCECDPGLYEVCQ